MEVWTVRLQAESEGMNPTSREQLRVNDRITLNSTARDWTRGRVFTIGEVKKWGVNCWTPPQPGEKIAGVSMTGTETDLKAWYPATWEQIEAKVADTLPGMSNRSSFNYPD